MLTAENMLRWAARLLSAALVGLFAVLLIGEGAPNLLKVTPAERALFACMLVMVAGLIIAWIKDWPGGTLTLVGYLGFVAVEGGLPGGWVFPLFPLAGVLFILAGRQNLMKEKRHES